MEYVAPVWDTYVLRDRTSLENLPSECAQNNGIWAITSFSLCLKHPLWKIVTSITSSAICLKLFMVYVISLPILLFPTIAPRTLLDLSAFINPSLGLLISILLSFLTLYKDGIIFQKTPSVLLASPLSKTLFMFLISFYITFCLGALAISVLLFVYRPLLLHTYINCYRNCQ